MSDDRLQEPGPLPPRPFQFSLRAMLIGVAVFAVLLGLAVSTFRAAREAALRAECVRNLKQIGLGLHNYHDVWKCFPPARTLGADGKAWHSWRVLISPFAMSSPFYDKYRMDESWDGPNNRKLHGTSLYSLFRCPAADPREPCTTSYVAVVGAETAWPGADSTSFRDMADGASNTILVVEMANSDIHWMEPRDLEFADLFPLGGGTAKLKPLSDHRGGFHVLFADGSVLWLPADVAREKLREMLTREGGSPVSWKEFSQ